MPQSRRGRCTSARPASLGLRRPSLSPSAAPTFFFGKGIIIIYYTAAELVLADIAPLRAEAVPRPRQSQRGRLAMGLPGLFKLEENSIVAKVDIVYDRPDWLCRALKQLLIDVWWDDLQKLDFVVSDAAVDCYQYCNPDDRNVAIGVMLKGLGITHCVVRGGIGDTKSRESAPTVDLRRDALEIVIAQLPQDHPAVLALSYLVRPDVRDAAQAVREAPPAIRPFKPVAYSKYPDYLRAQTLRELRDAIDAGSDVVVDQASTVDADKVIGFLAACFPHKRTAARTIDSDIHFFMDMMAYFQKTKKEPARLIYLARKYAAVPAVHMLLCAWLLCGGNEFMVGYIALASRTNKGNATERETFFAMLDQMMAGARPVMSLDELFDFLCATREERIRVVFALIYYFDAPSFACVFCGPCSHLTRRLVGSSSRTGACDEDSRRRWSLRRRRPHGSGSSTCSRWS